MNDVISGVAVDHVGVDVHIKFGDSMSNGSRDIRRLISCGTNKHDRSLSREDKTPVRRFT